MSSNDGPTFAWVAFVAVLAMVVFSTPVASAAPGGSAAAGQGVNADIQGGETSAQTATDICIEFLNDGVTQCTGDIQKIHASYTVVDAETPGQLDLKITLSTLPAGIEAQARIDDGEWATSTDGSPLSIDNTYPDGSVQYPTITVRLRDSVTGTSLGVNSMVFDDGLYIRSDDQVFTTSPNPSTTASSGATGDATVVGDDQRTVQRPTYSYVSRFNDNDENHEHYEDKTLPPVKYEDGVKVGGPLGNVTYFENLRDSNGFPAIFASDSVKNRMRLGTAMLGIPSGEYGKIRVDYGLQTESIDQPVQVNLVNRYGEVIDESMADASGRRLYHTVSSTDPDFFKTQGQYEEAISEDNLNSQTTEFTLTYAERQYIKENNEIYMEFSTNQRAYLMLYRTPIITQSITNATNNNWVPDETYFEENFDSNLGDDRAATFDAQYKVVGSLNEEYETFDRLPNEPLELEVTVTNRGDTRVQRTIGIYDQSEHNSSPDTLGVRNVSVEPHSSTRFTITKSWKPHEYGNHSLTVVDSTDENNPIQITRERDGTAVTDVYVLQPATFNITEIYHPPNWLVYDNFNVTVVVRNEGDLSGTATLNGEFQDWEGTMTVPPTEGGIVRDNTKGEYMNVTFDREGYNYSPSYPERPPNGPVNDQERPNSPYGVRPTYPEGGGHNPSKFDAEVTHPWANPNDDLHDQLTDTATSGTIRMYKMEIITMMVEGSRTDDYTWYASGAPEINFTDSSEYWSAGHYADAHDILDLPQNGMPTYEDSQFIYSPLNTDKNAGEEDRRMTLKVRVFNNGTAYSGTARVRVTTDKQGFEGKTVGTAGAKLPDPWQYKWIDVPVVIPNDENNDGTHNLTVEVRTEPDYIRAFPDEEIQSGQPSSLAARSVEVEVQLWEDFLAQDLLLHSTTINEQCQGSNPEDDGGDSLNCNNADEETLDFDAYWKNVGGVEGDFTAQAQIVTERDPSGACNVGPCEGESQYSNLGYVDSIQQGGMVSPSSFWDAQRLTIAPGENKTYQARNIPFDEPGVYRVRAQPHRANHEDPNLEVYENDGFAPLPQQKFVKVLDVTHPEAYVDVTDTRYPCKSNTCSQLDGDQWTIWEGGTLEFSGDGSSDNVRLTEYRWWIEGGTPNGGYTDCSGTHCYSNGGYSDGHFGRDGITHRFDTPGSQTVRLRVKDDPAYGAGATLNTSGTPNEDYEDYTVNVVDDTQPPSVNVFDSYHNNRDGSPDSSTVWESYSSTGYDGIEVCFHANQNDNAIGIESDQWWGVSGGDNDDTRCRTWSATGDKTIRYKAWDFSGLSDEDTHTVDVQHDSSPPSASLSGSRERRWHSYGPSGYHTTVTWSGSASDSETGLINCGDGGWVSWSGSSGSDGFPGSCSEDFTTEYYSAGTYDVRMTVEDYHGNTNSASDSVTLYHDGSPPSASGDSDSCYSGESDENGCTARACVSASDGQTGIWKYEPSRCISVSAYADADPAEPNPNPSAPSNPACETEECNEDCDTTSDTARDTESDSQTVRVYNNHGEYTTVQLSVDAEDYDRDTRTSCEEACSTGGSCPVDDPCDGTGIEAGDDYCSNQ